MNTRNEKLLSFLIGNMKDMELELRAQSMVLEAIATRVVDIDHLSEALDMARNSNGMRHLVAEKYRLLAEDLDSTRESLDQETQGTDLNHPVLIN